MNKRALTAKVVMGMICLLANPTWATQEGYNVLSSEDDSQKLDNNYDTKYENDPMINQEYGNLRNMSYNGLRDLYKGPRIQNDPETKNSVMNMMLPKMPMPDAIDLCQPKRLKQLLNAGGNPNQSITLNMQLTYPNSSISSVESCTIPALHMIALTKCETKVQTEMAKVLIQAGANALQTADVPDHKGVTAATLANILGEDDLSVLIGDAIQKQQKEIDDSFEAHTRLAQELINLIYDYVGYDTKNNSSGDPESSCCASCHNCCSSWFGYLTCGLWSR